MAAPGDSEGTLSDDDVNDNFSTADDSEGAGDDLDAAGDIPVMATFQDEDGTDENASWTQLSNLKLDFDRGDIKFWFSQFEMHLTTAGIKKQWSKRILLHKQLPPDVIAETKDILRKAQTEAGATPYKDLKERILGTFGTKPEDDYYKAKAMVMTGKPSQLAKTLVNTICPAHPDLVGCCAAGTVSGMWRDQLPTALRVQMASRKLVGADNMKDTLDTADSVYATMTRPGVPALPVAAVANLDTSADEPALQQVAAVQNRRNQPKKKPATSSGAAARDRGDPHPDGPPPNACNLHWKYGRGAYTCRKKDTCPWAHYKAPKPT